MNQILNGLLILIFPALIGYSISLLLRIQFGYDYSAYLTAGATLFVAFTPLVVVIFFNSNFNLPFYEEIIKFAIPFLVGCIVDTIFRPIFIQIFEK